MPNAMHKVSEQNRRKRNESSLLDILTGEKGREIKDTTLMYAGKERKAKRNRTWGGNGLEGWGLRQS